MTGPFKLIGQIRCAEPIVRKVVHITRTRNVPDKVVDAVVSGIRLILDTGRLNIEIKDLRNWGLNADSTIEYQSLNWYQSQASIPLDHGFGRQVDSGHFLSLALREPFQLVEPHFEAMIIDNDLNSQRENGQYINFLFAGTWPEFGFVLSIARLSTLPEKYFLSIIRKWAAHEFGHTFGLVNRARNAAYSIGMHCAGEKGPCLMQQALSMEESIRQHLEEEKTKQEICPDCQEELKTRALTFNHP
jgi:hypothetical protein